MIITKKKLKQLINKYFLISEEIDRNLSVSDYSSLSVDSINHSEKSDDNDGADKSEINGDSIVLYTKKHILTFSSKNVQAVGDEAKKIVGKIGGVKDNGSDADKQKIIDNIYKAAEVKGFSDKENRLIDLKKKLGTDDESYWSSWFLTVAYKVDPDYPRKGSMTYPHNVSYKKRLEVLNDPDQFSGKTFYMMFKSEECPVLKGDSIFSWRESNVGKSLSLLSADKPGPAHMRVCSGDDEFCGGNEGGTAKCTKMSLDNQKRITEEGYIGVFKKVKLEFVKSRDLIADDESDDDNNDANDSNI